MRGEGKRLVLEAVSHQRKALLVSRTPSLDSPSCFREQSIVHDSLLLLSYVYYFILFC